MYGVVYGGQELKVGGVYEGDRKETDGKKKTILVLIVRIGVNKSKVGTIL